MLRASCKLLNDADGTVLLSGWAIEISTGLETTNVQTVHITLKFPHISSAT
jgi:hypothetical protein